MLDVLLLLSKGTNPSMCEGFFFFFLQKIWFARLFAMAIWSPEEGEQQTQMLEFKPEDVSAAPPLLQLWVLTRNL